jgi:chaperone modulatory protein CbpM
MNEMQPTPAVTGNILEEYAVFSLDDLSRICAVEAQRIVDLVEEGILAVQRAEDAAHWRFAGAAVQRARIALRLQHDLEINLAGVALALDLLDEIEQLRRALRRAR